MLIANCFYMTLNNYYIATCGGTCVPPYEVVPSITSFIRRNADRRSISILR
jgi:hypothetical protein